MAKTIEALGIATVQVANLIPISLTMKVNRIVPSFAIPYPFGDPLRSSEEAYAMRRRIVEASLSALESDIKEQTVFPVEL